MSLTYTNGGTCTSYMAAAAAINNQTKGTILLWFNFGSVTPATQYNLWGKSSAGNRFVGTIVGGGTGTFQCVYAGGTQNCNATVTAANLFNIGAGKECCLAFTWDFGSGNNPVMYTGDRSNSLQAIVTYSTQTPGSGTHDDSASNWGIGGTDAGGNNPTGTISRFMLWTGVNLSLGQLIDQQWRPHKTSGLISWLELGYNGATGDVADWSGNGNKLTGIANTTVGAHTPLGPLFSYDTYRMPFVVAPSGLISRLPLMGAG